MSWTVSWLLFSFFHSLFFLTCLFSRPVKSKQTPNLYMSTQAVSWTNGPVCESLPKELQDLTSLPFQMRIGWSLFMLSLKITTWLQPSYCGVRWIQEFISLCQNPRQQGDWTGEPWVSEGSTCFVPCLLSASLVHWKQKNTQISFNGSAFFIIQPSYLCSQRFIFEA